MSDCCPRCGQTIPSHLDPPVRLFRRPLAIYQRVAAAGKLGVDLGVLIEHVYGDNEPLEADRSFHVVICQMNKKLRAYGQEISQCVGIPGRYALRRPRPFWQLTDTDRQRIIDAMKRNESEVGIASQFNVTRKDVTEFLRPIRRLMAGRQSRRNGEKNQNVGPRKKLDAGKLSPSAIEVRGIWPTQPDG